ncbi:MAG: hypothetical protein EOP20_07245, partial [Hyphomicrobiales bacterium]
MKAPRPEGSIRPQTKVTVLLGAVIAVSIGAAVGLGGYTFVYAKGASYLGNDPNACANCHVMQDHLDGWYKSSHRSVATCNDCHTPAGFPSPAQDDMEEPIDLAAWLVEHPAASYI